MNSNHELLQIVGLQIAQVTAVIAIVALLVRLFARERPHLACVLWLVVVVKCLTPPLWSSHASL